MRKQIVGNAPGGSSVATAPLIDVERRAQVEVTSEDEAHPIEDALRAVGGGQSWRAGQPGPQTLRLRFDEPQRIAHIHLVFDERERARTQEFVLRWSKDGGQTYQEIVRQQFTFSPPGTGREVEEYAVRLDGVTALELYIVPDISGGTSRASVSEWTLA
jgi:hypothetical protein